MITVTPNTEKIYFKGTTVEIASVVARLEFAAPKDGKTIQVAPYWYENETAYNNGEETISIEGVEGFLVSAKYYDLALGTDPETYDPQTIQVAHDKVKADLESLGYTVVISGI
jgi:hypothetical protein